MLMPAARACDLVRGEDRLPPAPTAALPFGRVALQPAWNREASINQARLSPNDVAQLAEVMQQHLLMCPLPPRTHCPDHTLPSS